MLTKRELEHLIDHCLDNKGSSYRLNDRNGTTKLYNLVGAILLGSDYTTFRTRNDGNIGELIECSAKFLLNGERPDVAKAYQDDLTIDGVAYEVKVSANSKDLATPLYQATKPVLLFTPEGVALFSVAMVANIIANPFTCDYVQVNKKGGIRFKRNANAYGLHNALTERIEQVFGY